MLTEPSASFFAHSVCLDLSFAGTLDAARQKLFSQMRLEEEEGRRPHKKDDGGSFPSFGANHGNHA